MKTYYPISKFADTLVVLSTYHSKTVSTSQILDALPLEGDLESLSMRAGQNAGFELKLTKYALKKIIPPLLPVILVLKNRTEILIEIDKENKQYKLLDTEGKTTWVDKKSLEKEYTQNIFLLKQKDHIKIETEYLTKKKHWFWSSLKFSRSLYFDVLLASFLLNIFAVASPLFVRNVYDRVVPNAAFDTLFILSSGIILVYLFDILFRFLRTYLLEVSGKKSDIIISSKIFEHVLNLKLSHKFKSVGAFSNNIKEFDTLRNFLSSASLTILIDLPFTVLFLYVIYLLAGNIMFVPLIASVFMILYGLLITIHLNKHIDQTSKLSAWKSSVLIESLSALETIKSFGLNSMMQWKWEESVGKISHTNMKTKILTTSMSTLTTFVVQLSNVLVIILGVYAIHDKELTMGGLIAITMLTSRTLNPLVQVSNLLINYEHAKNSYTILNGIYNMPVEQNQEKNYIIREKIEGKIEFRNVSFSYPHSEELVLDNVSFVIEAGENVTILGNNGSGKSTLIKLIMGFYDASSGSILIDGIDIKQQSPSHLRKSLNYLPQDIVLFNGTIEENIQYALPEASTEAMIQSAKMSGLDTFIDKNPLGYHFPVEERGAGVSGGQRQLIAMARFFLRSQSSILLIDEPTNSVDNTTKQHLQFQLSSFVKNKTSLLISHEMELIAIPSRTLLFNEGKLVHDATKEEVLNTLQQKRNHES